MIKSRRVEEKLMTYMILIYKKNYQFVHNICFKYSLHHVKLKILSTFK